MFIKKPYFKKKFDFKPIIATIVAPISIILTIPSFLNPTLSLYPYAKLWIMEFSLSTLGSHLYLILKFSVIIYLILEAGYPLYQCDKNERH